MFYGINRGSNHGSKNFEFFVPPWGCTINQIWLNISNEHPYMWGGSTPSFISLSFKKKSYGQFSDFLKNSSMKNIFEKSNLPQNWSQLKNYEKWMVASNINFGWNCDIFNQICFWLRLHVGMKKFVIFFGLRKWHFLLNFKKLQFGHICPNSNFFCQNIFRTIFRNNFSE